MKKVFFLLTSLMIAFASCEKTPEGQEGETPAGEPTVSVSADQTFAEDNTAKLTLTLSAASKTEVKVTLAVADVQTGKTKLTADYDKNITIAAGETTAVVEVEADVFGLEAGDYQAAIKIASATGAKVAENAVVYINYSYEYKPDVNLYADAQVASDKTVKLNVALAKATNKDVKVTLVDGELSGLTFEYEKTVTIPAGETEKEIVVTVNIPENLAPGIYPLSIKIDQVENGVKGNAAEASFSLSYPFGVNITVEGVFDDWNDPNIKEWTLPEGQVLYDDIKKLKLTATEKYVYLYMQFYDPGFDFNMPINIYIDADGNPATGGFTGAVDNDTAWPPYETTNQGMEWYCELAFHDGDHYNNMHDWGTLYQYKPDAEPGQSVFAGTIQALDPATYDGSAICCVGEIGDDNIAQVEIQFQRSFFNITGNRARFAVKIMDGVNNWKALGILPQGSATDLTDPMSRQHVDMAVLDLPLFVQ